MSRPLTTGPGQEQSGQSESGGSGASREAGGSGEQTRGPGGQPPDPGGWGLPSVRVPGRGGSRAQTTQDRASASLLASRKGPGTVGAYLWGFGYLSKKVFTESWNYSWFFTKPHHPGKYIVIREEVTLIRFLKLSFGEMG